MEDNPMDDYEVLKHFGHCPMKAAEIVLDAKRGHDYAIRWLEIARNALSDRIKQREKLNEQYPRYP